MFNKGMITVVSFVWMLLIGFSTTNLSQTNHLNEFQYLSPLPGSELILPETNIIIRYGEAYQNSIPDDILTVVGSKSGVHKGRYVLAEENRTLIFYPSSPFEYDETVSVLLKNGLKSVRDEIIPSISFSFKVSAETPKIKMNNLIDACFDNSSIKNKDLFRDDNNGTLISDIDSLPIDFPRMNLDTVNNPEEGFLFTSPFLFAPNDSTYLIIMDNYGIPVFYRKSSSLHADFKKQLDGTLTYYKQDKLHFEVLDSSYNLTDSVSTGNGYTTDIHELVLLPDNHYLIMAYDYEYVRMDTIVAGGDSNAVVIGLIIQELDENKNVIFQWRSWDHIPITDATYDINLTDSLIDYVHGNAIEKDHDGHLLISSRHLDEITKINRQTGNLIWRWGGEHCKNNQFTFINDPIRFSHQHDIRRLPNGNVTLFDNGNLNTPPFSRGLEYQLDEESKVATLVWDNVHPDNNFSPAMGSTRRLNKNTLIGLGYNLSGPDILEIAPDGSTAISISFADTLYSYRAFKNNWKTNLFRTEPDEYDFDVVPLNDSLSVSIDLISNSPDTIFITSSYSRTGTFKISSSLPVAIPPYQTVPVQVQFKPDTAGYFKDVLHIRKETATERIAQLVKVTGRTDSSFTSVNDIYPVNDFVLYQNYPNPFNPSTKIKFTIPAVGTRDRVSVLIKVYDILGNEVATLVDEYKPAGNYEVEFNSHNLSSGIYFYRLKAGNHIETKSMVLLK